MLLIWVPLDALADGDNNESSRKMPPALRAQVRKRAFGFRLESNSKVIELSAGNNKGSLDAYLPMISGAIAENLAPNAIKQCPNGP